MNEPTDPIDLGIWDHDDAREGDQENPLEGQPSSEYHLYAERIIDASLAERMSDHWGEWWKWTVRSDQDRHFRMQMLIKRFGLVERSKLPEPVAVPEWVQRWLDGAIGPISTGKVWALKAWIGDALIAGAVRVETPDVPAEVKEAVSALSLMFKGAGPSGHTGTLYNWVLEQVGDSGG